MGDEVSMKAGMGEGGGGLDGVCFPIYIGVPMCMYGMLLLSDEKLFVNAVATMRHEKACASSKILCQDS